MMLSGLTVGKHRLDFGVLNTVANEVCGTLEQEKNS